MPFIMISNLILSFFVNKRKNISYVVGILLKGGFLLVAYYIMNVVIGLPRVFLLSVNLQFVTAAIGVLSAVMLYNIESKKN